MSLSLKEKINQLVQDLGGPETENVLCALRRFSGEAIEPLVSALQAEPNGSRRALLVEAIWQLRDERAVPVLLDVLSRDPDPAAWKEALDGLVTLGGPNVVTALEGAGSLVVDLPDAQLRLQWCQEALKQVRDRT
jgi:HEAT repeat protein